MKFEHMSSPPVFSGLRVTRTLVLCVMFCRSLFVPFSFLFWPLCCLFFFDLRILTTPLVSSNSSFDCLYLTFSRGRVGQSCFLCIAFSTIAYSMPFVVSVLQPTASFYSFGIFNLFFRVNVSNVMSITCT